MMDDVIDNVMEDADDEEETEEIVSKVLDELGLSLEGEVCAVPAMTNYVIHL
jgi:charged multivesicular body protein 2A